jgi:hypothetical protein
MTLLDWADTVLHGAPWLVLFFVLIRDLFVKFIKR